MEMNGRPYVPQMTSSYLTPVETRRLTDKFYIPLIPIHFLLWLGIGIYDVYANCNEKNSSLMFDPYQWTIIIYATAALLFTVLLIFVSSKVRNKWMVAIVILFIAIVIVTTTLLVATQLYTFINHMKHSFSSEFKYLCLMFTLVAIIALTVFYLIYQVTIFYYIRKVDFSLLAQIINEPSRAIVGSPLAVLFSFMIVCLSLIIMILTEKVILIQLVQVLKVTHFLCKYSFWLRILVFGFAGKYTFNVIWNFGYMVTGHYFANYYSNPVDQKGTYIFQSIMKISRYHFGTIAFLSIPIVPSIRAFIVAFNKTYQHGKQSSYIVVHVISKLCLVIDISEYASIQTSIYGCEASNPMSKVIALLHSNSALFLYGNVVSFKMAEISIVFTLVTGVVVEMLANIWHFDANLLPWDYINSTHPWRFFTPYVFESIVTASLMCTFILRPAMCTFLIRKMTRLRESGDQLINQQESSCFLNA